MNDAIETVEINSDDVADGSDVVAPDAGSEVSEDSATETETDAAAPLAPLVITFTDGGVTFNTSVTPLPRELRKVAKALLEIAKANKSATILARKQEASSKKLARKAKLDKRIAEMVAKANALEQDARALMATPDDLIEELHPDDDDADGSDDPTEDDAPADNGFSTDPVDDDADDDSDALLAGIDADDADGED